MTIKKSSKKKLFDSEKELESYIKKRIPEIMKNVEGVWNKRLEMEQQTQNIIENTEATFDAEVKSWGTSAHIPIQKRYAGKKAKVFIFRDKEDKTQDS